MCLFQEDAMKQSRILISVFLLFATVTFSQAQSCPTHLLAGVVRWFTVYSSAATQPMDINVSRNNSNHILEYGIEFKRVSMCCLADIYTASNYIFWMVERISRVNAVGAFFDMPNWNVSNNPGMSEQPSLILDLNDTNALRGEMITL